MKRSTNVGRFFLSIKSEQKALVFVNWGKLTIMGTAYNLMLLAHSWNRWLILISGIIVVVMALSRYLNKRPYTGLQKGLGITFLSSLHLQLIIGFALYFFLSPFTKMALNDFGSAMKNTDLRFWAVEHTILNILGIIMVQIGYSLAKRKILVLEKHQTTFIWMGIGLLLVIIAVPIGIMGVQRPWFRF